MGYGQARVIKGKKIVTALQSKHRVTGEDLIETSRKF